MYKVLQVAAASAFGMQIAEAEPAVISTPVVAVTSVWGKYCYEVRRAVLRCYWNLPRL